MSDVDALVAWLRAQWDADEKAALQAAWHDDSDTNWRLDDDGETVLFWDPMPDTPGAGLTVPYRAPHIARHDPADTLARIAAERRIVADYEMAAADAPPHNDAHDPYSSHVSVRLALLTAVRALASGYRRRAGWQEGWAP